MQSEDVGSNRCAATVLLVTALMVFGAAAGATAQTGPSMEMSGFGMADAIVDIKQNNPD